MSSEPARAILLDGAAALAHADGLATTLQALLGVLARELDIPSAVVVTAGDDPGGPAIVAAVGLGAAAEAGLGEAMRNPGHPIVRTLSDAVASFDVPPTAPGGPALRTHVPLIVTHGGSATVLGVLALAHQDPLAAQRGLIEATADLAAVALELGRGGPG